MADVTFIQRSRIGRSLFLLRGETLDVTGSFFGIKSSRQVSVRSISPDYQLVAQRFWVLIVVPMILAGIVAAAAYGLASQTFDGLEGLLFNLCLAFAMFAWAALRGVPRVELFVFFDQWKKPLFYIARERDQAAACESFIQDLLERIERVQQGLPADDATVPAVPVSSVRLPPFDEPAPAPRRQHFWKLCLAAGALTTGIPHLARATDSGSNELLAVVMLCSAAAAMGLGFRSFAAGERFRLLSFAGIALALLTLLLS